MKALRIFIGLAFFSISVQAQSWEFGSDFSLSHPVSAMKRNMSNAFGMNFSAAKVFKSPFAVGLDFGFAEYGSQTTRQQYTFDDGSVTETNVKVSNDIFNLNLTGRYFLRNGKKINPYVSGRLGWTWFTTTLTIEDPADKFSCHPLESDVLQKDNTYTASAGAGVRIDFSIFFPRVDKQKFFFDLSTNAIQGGTIRFMNVNKDPSQPPPTKDVMAKFINTQTQVIHEHHVGYLYTSLVNMMDFRLGVICRTGH